MKKTLSGAKRPVTAKTSKRHPSIGRFNFVQIKDHVFFEKEIITKIH